MAYRTPLRPRYPAYRPTQQLRATSMQPVRGLRALPAEAGPDWGPLMEELRAIMQAHEQQLTELVAHKTSEIEVELARIKEVKSAQKGDAGMTPIAGVHYPVPQNGKDADEAAIEARLHARLAQLIPEALDPHEIADLVAALIPPPAPAPDTETLLAHVLSHLTEKKLLRPEHIAGLEEMFNDVRRKAGGTMRGGGDTVVAGTNVTIAKNTAGRKVISASGGLTELAATETPTGLLTVFTFAGATAKPSYIVSDNVWMKAISKAGTVNWTWNAVTKKATMTVAPQDDIFAVV